MSKHPAKWCMCLAHDWNVKSQDKIETVVFRECLAGKAFSWDTRKTCCFAKLSFLIHTFCAYTIYTHITHRCWGVLLRENLSHKPWELEIVIPTILYTNTYGFSLTPTSPFLYHWEVDSQTLTTLFQSVKWDFGVAWKYWKKPSFGGCNRAYCGIRRVRQDTVSRSLVRIGA